MEATTTTTSYSIQIIVLFSILILSIIFNIFLFYRGNESYSVKYQIMLNDSFFRRHPIAVNLVEIIYKTFFGLPFLLLIVIAIIRAFVDFRQFFTIIVNGMILILIIYPFKTNFFYVKLIIIWILAILSQFISLYWSESNFKDYYRIFSFIFYPINCVLFCLALMCKEKFYWQISHALKFQSIQNQLNQIYPYFLKNKKENIVQVKDKQNQNNHLYDDNQSKIIKNITVTTYPNIPQIFDGGLYGILCSTNRKNNKGFIILYSLSILMLILNGILIWISTGSSLGFVGLITNFIYDLFIFVFNILQTSERSVRNVFILIYFGRFMSFLFGQELWIFGYCFIYLFAGIFIGKIIVNDKFPLKNLKEKKLQKQKVNAFRTPQFVFFILTVQIFLLVLASSYGIGNNNPIVKYNQNISIPLWQFALLVVIATWIIILYIASHRMYRRFENKIHDNVQYYFGISKLKVYHIYILITYALIVGLGLFCYIYLYNLTVLYSSIFLPLIALSLSTFIQQWINNQFQILAKIPQYNSKIQKKKKIIIKKKQAIEKQKNKLKNSSSNKFITIQSKQIIGSAHNLMGGNDKLQSNQNSLIALKKDTQSQNDQIKTDGVQQISQMIHQLKQKQDQLKSLKNWRDLENPSLTILWDRFTPSDKIILIMILQLSLLFIGYILCCYLIEGSIFGIFIIISLVSFLSIMPFYKYIRTYDDLAIQDYIWYYCGLLLGVVYWSFYHKHFAQAMLWAVSYIIALIIILMYGISKNIKKQVLAWLIVNIVLTIVFIIIFIFFTLPTMIAILIVIIIGMIGLAAIPIVYSRIHGNISTLVKVICSLLIVGCITALSVVAYIEKIVDNFTIFSFILLVSYIIIFSLACLLYYQIQNNKYEAPHVYSAYGLPIYKFESSQQKLKSSQKHLRLYDLSSIILVAYAVVVTLAFQNKQYAIYALGVYQCLSFLYNILFSIKTYNQIAQNKQYLTEELLLSTLKELNQKYMIDFKQIKDRPSQFVRNVKQQLKKQINEEDPAQLDEKWLKIAILNKQQVKHHIQESKFFFFWISLIIFHINNNIKAKKNNYLIQVKQIQQQLIQEGIFLQSINLALDFDRKYEVLNIEIKNLSPNDYLVFEYILQEHQKHSLVIKSNQNKQSQNIAQQQREKEDKIFQQLQKELRKTTTDKITQFNTAIKNLGKKQLFKDQQFPNTQDSLGSLASYVQKWRRPCSAQELIKGSISAQDVRQGQIGNCYLISSLAVLGEKWIKLALGQDDKGKKLWKNQKGAYMVRFFKFFKEVFIIIDDFLPVDQHGSYVFAKSEQQNQIWPCILEKAYAKLYSGYHNIIQGQCHRVFSQFSGGVPFQFLIKEYESNPNGLWSKVISSINNKYLMGAGTHPHDQGDKAFSKRNIIFGHAYSILDAKQVQGNKLIKLKNPHATGGREWNGDFSDQSEFMTDRLMKILGHEKKNDGIFWMKIQDFIYEFRALYMCCIFDQSIFKKIEINGQFTLENSFGTPSKSDNTFKNPQYGIVITKKCTVFINLTQKDTISTYEGKNFIFLRVQMINGKRINKLNKNDGVCGLQQKSKNTISVSTQVILQSDFYPQTFTLFTSCLQEGDTGQYKLQIYSSDKDTTIIDDKDFDRQNF